MGYKISIVETRSIPKTETTSFIVEKRPLTDEEVREHYSSYYNGERERGEKTIYGTRDEAGTKEVETKIYEQVVEELDLKAVIGAINK